MRKMCSINLWLKMGVPNDFSDAVASLAPTPFRFSHSFVYTYVWSWDGFLWNLKFDDCCTYVHIAVEFDFSELSLCKLAMWSGLLIGPASLFWPNLEKYKLQSLTRRQREGESQGICNVICSWMVWRACFDQIWKSTNSRAWPGDREREKLLFLIKKLHFWI